MPKLFQKCLTVLQRRLIPKVTGYETLLARKEASLIIAAHNSRHFISLIEAMVYDATRYWRFATFGDAMSSKESALSRMMAMAHCLEKGLSFPRRKRTFGLSIANDLISLLNLYLARHHSWDDKRLDMAIAVLRDYYEHHDQTNSLPQDMRTACLALFSAHTTRGTSLRPTRDLTRTDLQQAALGDYRSLASSRHSIRDFTKEPVDDTLIRQALSLATYSPSVCNRQTIRVLCLSRGEDMNVALTLQNGNRGFTDSIDKLLIVGADLRCFLSHHERNQAFIDAGIFGMSLVHSLQFLGLGTCFLNWAVDSHTDSLLQKGLRIPDWFRVTFFVAVGHLPTTVRVAASHRLDVEHIITVRQDVNSGPMPSNTPSVPQ